MHRQAIIVDGDRLGWRRGLTSKIVGWTDLDDVEAATGRRCRRPITKDRKVDVILWTSVAAGCRASTPSCCAGSCRPTCGEQLDDRAGSSEPLHPFIVPFSALSDDGRTVIGDLLAARGLLPS